MLRLCRSVMRFSLVLLLLVPAVDVPAAEPAEVVLLGGRVLTMDAASRIVESIAIRDGRILATGSDEGIKTLVGDQTKVVELDGKTVIPGIIAAHCHAVGVARNELDQPYEQLLSISEVQAWIRRCAQVVPPGTWIRVPRADITRLKEHRHPTVAELDAACDTHPVLFTAARKHAVNSLGLAEFGISDQTSAFELWRRVGSPLHWGWGLGARWYPDGSCGRPYDGARP